MVMKLELTSDVNALMRGVVEWRCRKDRGDGKWKEVEEAK